ncbi:MAG: RDD family protein [Actinomycetota bacterium]|nr:RDD family protein [Actinomycetota bacterium]
MSQAPPPPPAPPPQDPGGYYGQPGSGAGAGPSGPRAGFWIRFAAAFIDGIIIGVVATILRFAIGFYPAFGLQIALGFLYFGYFEGGPSGQTLGKKAVDIRVTRFADYGPLGWGTALLRHACSYLSQLVCLLGYFWMLWDSEKMTWHDKLSQTVVVPAAAVPPPPDSFGKPPVG